MKTLTLVIILTLFSALALAQSSSTIYGTVTPLNGGGTWTPLQSSNGSSAQILTTPGGTVIVNQWPSAAERSQRSDQLHEDTMRSIERLDRQLNGQD